MMPQRTLQMHIGEVPGPGEHAWRPVVHGDTIYQATWRKVHHYCPRCGAGPATSSEIAKKISRVCRRY